MESAETLCREVRCDKWEKRTSQMFLVGFLFGEIGIWQGLFSTLEDHKQRSRYRWDDHRENIESMMTVKYNRQKLHAIWIVLQFFSSNISLWNYRIIVSHKIQYKIRRVQIYLLTWFCWHTPYLRLPSTATATWARRMGKMGLFV